MSGRTTRPDEHLDASDLRVAVVVARFHPDITEALLDGAVRCLKEHGGPEPTVLWVAGAFELPLVCRELALAGKDDVAAPQSQTTRQPMHRFDAIVALGCVIRGETSHFDYVAGGAAHGIMHASLETGVPISFGVLTTEDLAQAEARAGGELGNKGYDSALTAIETALILRRVR